MSGNIFVLSGAGASIPFIQKSKGETLTSAYLKNQLVSGERWRGIAAKFVKNCLDKEIKKQFEEHGSEIIRAITDLIQKIEEVLWEHRRDFYNFEHIIEILDQVSTYRRQTDNIGNYINAAIEVHRQCDKNLKEPSFTNRQVKDFESDNGTDDRIWWDVVPYLAREIIVDSIFDLWQTSQKKEEGIYLLKNFLAGLLSEYNRVCVYTLNYDPLLWEAVKFLSNIHNIQTGFKKDKFYPELFLKSKEGLQIAFLHGFLGFVPCGGTVCLNKSYEEAQRRRMELGGHQFESIPSIGNYFNTFLVTGINKFFTFLQQPFASYLFKFALDLADADILLTIGYSFRDHHLNSLIKNYVLLSKQKPVIMVFKKEGNYIRSIYTKCIGKYYMDEIPVPPEENPEDDLICALCHTFETQAACIEKVPGACFYQHGSNPYYFYFCGAEKFFAEDGLRIIDSVYKKSDET